MDIPHIKDEEFAKEQLDLAKEITFYGFLLEELTRDELMIACAYAGELIKTQQSSTDSFLSFMKDLNDARGRILHDG